MHILHVTPYYVPAYSFGGVVRAVEGLAREQVTQGHEVTVLTTDALTLESRLTERERLLAGVRVHYLPNRIYALRKVNLSTPAGMRRRAADLLPQVDVVHLHEFRTIENLLMASLAKQSGKPVILSPHGTINRATGRSTLKQVWDALLSPRIAQHIDHVVALVAPERDDVRALWDALGARAQFSIVPNGIDPAPFQHLPDAAAFREIFSLGEDRVLLFMGRLHERKGVLPLLRAFLQADLPRTKLVFAGPDEGTVAQLKAAGDERVIFTGYLEGDARLEALAAADVFALPAVGEGLSMAVLEAMAASVPVLLSPGCNLPQAAEVGAGRIVAVNVDDLANALRQLFTADDLPQMGANGRKLVLERYTWAQVTQAMNAIYAAHL